MPLTEEFKMPQVPETSSNAAQIEYWNTTAGETWAQFQEALDRQVEPLGLAAMDVLCPGEGEHIIDIGCGCGQTSLALAARVQPIGSVVGVDISEPMLDVALRRPRSADLQVAFRKLDAHVRLQMLWESLSCLGTEALARLSLSLGGFQLMLQSSQFDGVAFDPFSFQKDGLASAEVDVGRR